MSDPINSTIARNFGRIWLASNSVILSSSSLKEQIVVSSVAVGMVERIRFIVLAQARTGFNVYRSLHTSGLIYYASGFSGIQK